MLPFGQQPNKRGPYSSNSSKSSLRTTTGCRPNPAITIARSPTNDYPNLRKRPRTPAKGRGSVQRAIKRAFAAVYRDHGISGAKGRDKRSAFDKAVP